MDVAYIQSLAENEGSMFQAASNFNGVEATGEHTHPAMRNFITDYIDDMTQGPAASISAGAGAISRVLLPFYDTAKGAHEWGQTKTQQVEMLGDVSEYFTVKNGYVVQNGSEKTVDADLSSQENRDLVSKVKVLVHADEEVVYGPRELMKEAITCVGKDDDDEAARTQPNHKICQVFCAAMNMGQGESGFKNAGIEGSDVKAKLLLEAAYRGTYLAAIRHGCPKLFLTLIGGGVFGNSQAAIMDTIEKVHMDTACTEKNNAIKEVHVVMFNPVPTLQKFVLSLQGKGVDVELVAYKNGKFVDFDIDEALAMKKDINEYEFNISALLSK